MAVKFLGADGSGTTSDAIAAVRYAFENGAHISNNSWGGDPYSQAMYDAIRDARDVGHIFVAAAGNGNWLGIGQDNDATPFYPASYDLENVVAVAATDRNDQRGIFSNFGATSVDIGAPGVSILSTTINGGYASYNGTSMAAPHVTGALSLVRDHNPSLTASELIDRVLLSADPVESMAGITVTGGRLNLASSLIPDVTGPTVAAVDPNNLILDPFSQVRITFNETIDVDSFTLSDIDTFSGPQGSISITSLVPVVGSNGRAFDLNFATQSESGIYELVVGSDIQDRFGNSMDQDGDGVGGELADDRFQHAFTKADPIGRFDFGTASSPVASGYTRVVGGDAYNPQTGYGWSQGAVYSLSRGGEPLTQDFNYTADAVFSMDVPNGEYDVMVTLGESIVAHDQMGVYLEGVQVDSVTTAAGQFVTRTYRTSVSDGQLTLGLRDLGGSDSWVMINGLDVVFAGPDRTGPVVNLTDASGTRTGPIDRLTVSFNELIQASSFTLEDVVSLQGPSGDIVPSAVNALPSGAYEMVFESQNESGLYRLVIGPEIVDIAGNPMDQDGDGIAGEIPDDRFASEFTLEAGLATVAAFDFGNATSPLAGGYTRVTGANAYSVGTGYGWQGGPVYTISWGGEPLTQDLNYTRDARFLVDLPNGEYDVVVTMGEAIIPHDQMGVFVEGVQVDSVSTAAYEFTSNTYRTSISDGQLTLGLKDLCGSNLYAVINGLKILYVGPDTTGPRVDATDATGDRVGPIDRVRVAFNEPILSGTFTAADIVRFEGPEGAVVVSAVNQIAAGEFEIVFDTRNDAGLYELALGPDILDIAGNPMDQDGDGVAGEAVEDRFASSFTLQPGLPTIARFDFGTTSSPVGEGYTSVTSSDRYSVEKGYGWRDGSVYSISWGGQPLTRDLNYTADATFALDVPNGQYDLVVTMGEAIISHDQMGVFVEGVQQDTVSTAGFQFVTNTYRAAVVDGQISLRLKDFGGSNAWAVINALEVLYVGN